MCIIYGYIVLGSYQAAQTYLEQVSAQWLEGDPQALPHSWEGKCQHGHSLPHGPTPLPHILWAESHHLQKMTAHHSALRQSQILQHTLGLWGNHRDISFEGNQINCLLVFVNLTQQKIQFQIKSVYLYCDWAFTIESCEDDLPDRLRRWFGFPLTSGCWCRYIRIVLENKIIGNGRY